MVSDPFVSGSDSVDDYYVSGREEGGGGGALIKTNALLLIIREQDLSARLGSAAAAAVVGNGEGVEKLSFSWRPLSESPIICFIKVLLNETLNLCDS